MKRLGVDNGRAKLTEADVLAIRGDSRPHRDIAKAYSLKSHSEVWRIKQRKRWAHVEGEASK
jgi:hypothetical protein